MEKQPITLTTVLLVLSTVALWGGTPVAISFSVESLPPMAVAAIRFLLAAVFMLFWCRFEGSSIVMRRDQVVPCTIAGLLLFFQISTFTIGVANSNSSHSSLMINTYVFWVVGFEHFVTKADQLTKRKSFGLLTAAAGVVVLLSTVGKADTSAPEVLDTATLMGDGLVLISAFLLGIKVLYTKHALKTVEPGKLILWHDITGVVLFAIASVCFETIPAMKLSTPAVLGLLYQGFAVAGYCFAMNAVLLRRHSASQLAVFSFATPIFGVLFGVIFRGDLLSPWLFAAGACVATGILLVNTGRQTG